jgi:hypothetical protein
VVLKLGHFGKQIRNNWKVFKCGVGEGWRLSFGSNVGEMEYNKGSRRRGIFYMQNGERRLTGLVTFWVGTAF